MRELREGGERSEDTSARGVGGIGGSRTNRVDPGPRRAASGGPSRTSPRSPKRARAARKIAGSTRSSARSTREGVAGRRRRVPGARRRPRRARARAPAAKNARIPAALGRRSESGITPGSATGNAPRRGRRRGIARRDRADDPASDGARCRADLRGASATDPDERRVEHRAWRPSPQQEPPRGDYRTRARVSERANAGGGETRGVASPERKRARTFGEASDAECTTGNGACVCGMRDGGAHRAGETNALCQFLVLFLQRQIPSSSARPPNGPPGWNFPTNKRLDRRKSRHQPWELFSAACENPIRRR